MAIKFGKLNTEPKRETSVIIGSNQRVMEVSEYVWGLYVCPGSMVRDKGKTFGWLQASLKKFGIIGTPDGKVEVMTLLSACKKRRASLMSRKVFEDKAKAEAFLASVRKAQGQVAKEGKPQPSKRPYFKANGKPFASKATAAAAAKRNGHTPTGFAQNSGGWVYLV